jgi:hypothetical protein
MERFEVHLSFFTDAWSAEDAILRAQALVETLNDHQSVGLDEGEGMSVHSETVEQVE